MGARLLIRRPEACDARYTHASFNGGDPNEVPLPRDWGSFILLERAKRAKQSESANQVGQS